MNELMIGVSLPVGGFTTAGDYDAGPPRGAAGGRLHGGGQVHQGGYGTQHPLRVIHQADQFAQGGFAAQVDDTLQAGMMMAGATDLNKLDSSLEMIDHGLVALRLPPFDGDVVLPAGGDDPKGSVLPGKFVDLGVPGLFLG
jgi:hypothetical protein